MQTISNLGLEKEIYIMATDITAISLYLKEGESKVEDHFKIKVSILKNVNLAQWWTLHEILGGGECQGPCKIYMSVPW